MRLREVEGVDLVLATSELGTDAFWGREEFGIGPNDIQLFYARAGLKGQRQLAIELVDEVQGLVIRALFDGRLPKGAFAPLVLHEPPPSPYMADEFLDGLVKLSPVRRGACIFALENHLRPVQVTELFWVGLDLRGVSQTSKEVIAAARALRHLKLPYVFWEWATKDIASPLLGLDRSIERAFAMSVIDLQMRYDRMVMVDRRAECASFISLAKQLDAGR